MTFVNKILNFIWVCLGAFHEKGLGVTQDYKKAAYWYQKAAKHSDALGQRNLGSLYYRGLGVPQDSAQAEHWLRKAAEQGYADAQYLLGGLYLRGVPKDFGQMHDWLRKTFEEGSDAAAAQYREAERLGGLYLPEKKDVFQAYFWLTVGLETGRHDPLPPVGAELARKEAANLLTPAQIEEANKLAREWKTKRHERAYERGLKFAHVTGVWAARITLLMIVIGGVSLVAWGIYSLFFYLSH